MEGVAESNEFPPSKPQQKLNRVTRENEYMRVEDYANRPDVKGLLSSLLHMTLSSLPADPVHFMINMLEDQKKMRENDRAEQAKYDAERAKAEAAEAAAAAKKSAAPAKSGGAPPAKHADAVPASPGREGEDGVIAIIDGIIDGAKMEASVDYADDPAAVAAAIKIQNMSRTKKARATTHSLRTQAEHEAKELKESMVVFVLGGPGSGKGTQCERIVRDFGFKHLSAGDLLREEVAAGTTVGKKCEALMKEGKLVPMKITIALLRNAMLASKSKHFLIDGFPRALDQAEAFEKSITSPSFTLFFDCPLETMQERLLKRGETSGRSDDNIDTIKKRFDTFQNQSIAVVEHYAAEGKVKKISSVPHPDEVYTEVRAMFEDKLEHDPKAKMAEAAEARIQQAEGIIVFVLGGPGSGKGTQCERIVRDYGFKHLLAGDLLRDEVASGSELGLRCEKLMKEGKLVPMEVTIGLLRKAMFKSDNKKFLIDGFPRALDQAKAFEDQIAPCTFVLFIDCPLETMQARLLKRGETSGRSDDNIDTIKKRFDTFTNQSLPVITYFETHKKVYSVSSVNPADEVYGEVQKIFNTQLKIDSAAKAEAAELKMEATVVFVLGGPGSGKGTQCERIVRDFHFKHLSAGDLLRDEVASGSPLGQECEKLMKEGKLVPMSVTIGLLRKSMVESPNKKFLIDGFPRALDQAKAFEASIIPCTFSLFIDCPLETMQQRLLKRGETSGRSDDNIATIKKRFDTFTNQSLPVVDYFESQGKSYKVSSVNPPDEVYEQVKSIFIKSLPADDLPADMAVVKQAAPEPPLVVFVLGGPGSGKGTQCERIVRDYGFKHLSAGDLLRDEVASGSELGQKCEKLMKEGKLVPMDVTIGLLKTAMDKSPNRRFLIDGFPRALDQAKAFEQAIVKPAFTLFIDCPLETMQARLLKRGETSGRSDDNIDTIKKRFDTFTNQSLPVVSYYEAQGLMTKVSSINPPDEVYKQVQKAFNLALHTEEAAAEPPTVVFVLGGPGSGKGTQCERIVRDFGFKHLSAGDLLRDEVASGSELGQKCEALMKEGKLVPMEVTIGLLKTAMDNSPNKRFLIDGFPRALDQALAFEDQIVPCNFVLFIDCSLETMQKRLLKRGETSGRSDDNIATIKKRFDTFTNQSMAVVDHFGKAGKVFRVSSNPAPDLVYNNVKAIFKNQLNIEGPTDGPTVVFVLGGPGSGKGTQCERIVRDFEFKHLSAGDLLRDEVASGSALGKSCEALMKEGKLVPMEVTIGLLKTAMDKSDNKKFLIDGFPRALDQAKAFEASVGPCTFTLFFDCPLKTMQERLLKRGETSGRSDDNIATIKKRFDTFQNQSLAVVDYFDKQGKVFKLSSVPAPDTVYEEVKAIFGGDAGAAKPEAVEGWSADQEAAALKIQLATRGKKARLEAQKMREEAMEAKKQMEDNALVIFVLGGPGSGKGTQCERIVRDFKFKHLSAGDLLRDEVAAGTTVGKKCETLMKEGKLVPMDVTIALLKNAMEKSANKRFLIDGFPRALDQALAFEKEIMEPEFTLFFDCPLETMQERLLKRGETSGRSDDNIDTIKKRFDTFQNQSIAVVDYYEKKDKVFKVSSVPAADDVYNDVKQIFQTKLSIETVVFVLGGPGSGKGTQCERLVAKYKFKHLSAGDLLREEVASGSELGKACEKLMKEGKLVPMETTLTLLKAAMEKSKNKKFLIDGFPRALDQGLAFEREIVPCSYVLFFDCPLETMQQRLLKRGETSGRSDDNLDTIKKRFDTFTNQSLPVVDYYTKQGKAFTVSSVPHPDEVFAEVMQVIEVKGPGAATDAQEMAAAALKMQIAARGHLARAEMKKKQKESAEMAQKLREVKIIFVLGGPGSGKGTQCERIVHDFGFKHLSAGDLLREEVAAGTTVGKKCETLMKEGKLVPMSITIALLRNAMEKALAENPAAAFLIDGFPRALDQALAFEKEIGPCKYVLFFDCPLETMQERLLKRGETSGRSDDNIDTIKKRFDTFQNQSIAVVEHYEKEGKVHKLSSVPPPDEVYTQVNGIITASQ